MTKIQILGSGCDKCRKLAANAKLAAERLAIPFEMEKIEDINQITAFGVMMTPALAVNGKVVSSGKVLSPEDIASILSSPACDCGSQCTSPETKPTESSCCCGSPAKSASSSCCCGSPAKSASSCCGGGKQKILTVLLLLLAAACIVFLLVRHFRTV